MQLSQHFPNKLSLKVFTTVKEGQFILWRYDHNILSKRCKLITDGSNITSQKNKNPLLQLSVAQCNFTTLCMPIHNSKSSVYVRMC